MGSCEWDRVNCGIGPPVPGEAPARSDSIVLEVEGLVRAAYEVCLRAQMDSFLSLREAPDRSPAS